MAGEGYPSLIKKEGTIYQFDGTSNSYRQIPDVIQKEGDTYALDNNSGHYIQQIQPQNGEGNNNFDPEAARVGFEKAMSFGTRPFIGGVIEAAKSLKDDFSQGKPIGESLSNAGNKFTQNRDWNKQNQDDLENRSPYSFNLGGAGAQAGMTLLPPGLGGLIFQVPTYTRAAALGMGMGAGNAIGEAQSIPEAGLDIAKGGVGGMLGKAVFELAGTGLNKLNDLKNQVLQSKIAAKIFHTPTGMPEKDIQTYMEATDRINAMNAANGGDNVQNVKDAKKSLMDDIKVVKDFHNKNMSISLQGSNPNKDISGLPIIDSMEQVKSELDPDSPKKLVEKVDNLINYVLAKMDGRGRVNLKDLNFIRQNLGENASKFKLDDGKFYRNDTDVARAAAAGFGETKKILGVEAPLEYLDALKAHAEIHQLQDETPIQLLRQKSPPATYNAAGSGQNPNNEEQLRKISAVTEPFTGNDLVQRAREVSAANTFNNPSALPMGEKTGYAVTRMASGSAVGYALAKAVGLEDPKMGAFIGAALTGPIALKAFINANNISSKMINSFSQQLTNPAFQSVAAQYLGSPKKVEELGSSLLQAAFERDQEERFKNQNIPDQNNSVQRELMKR